MTKVDADDAISALLRMDFAFFVWFAFRELGGEGEYQHNWHIDAIIHQLNRVQEGEVLRLLVTIPPRHLKSRIISIAWVAWRMGHNPALAFLCISYGQDLAEDHARDCLRIIESRWFRRAFPSFRLARRSVADFATTAGGRRIATSVDGVTTGFGADIIIVDDPMKAQDAMSQAARDKSASWYDETLSQRLNDQGRGVIIVVMQRLHEADLIGVLKERDGFTELCLPAIAEKDEVIPLTRGRSYRRREGRALHPARQPLELLLRRKADNPYVFAGQFQQNPVPALGNIVNREWLAEYDPATLDRSRGQIVLSLDTASKDNPFNDWTVAISALVVGKSIYILDVFRARLQFPELLARTTELARLHGATVLLIEDASSGQQLIQSLRAQDPAGVPPPIARRPQGDKIARAMGASALIQAGRLFLPKTAHWLADFTSELLGFPASRHDDQVDALTQLLLWVQEKDIYRPETLTGPELVDIEDGATHYKSDPNIDPWL